MTRPSPLTQRGRDPNVLGNCPSDCIPPLLVHTNPRVFEFEGSVQYPTTTVPSSLTPMADELTQPGKMPRPTMPEASVQRNATSGFVLEP